MRAFLVAIALAVAVVVPVSSPTVVAAASPTTIDGLYAGAGAIGQGVTTTMTVVGRGNVPLTGVGAVALNVTVTEPTASSFLTVWPTGNPRPVASNLDFVAGQTVANSVLTKVGTDGTISIYNNTGAAQVVIDVVGWFPDNQSFVGVVPARLADTRNLPTIDGKYANTGPVGQQTSINVGVLGRGAVPASGVGAVALNVTATNPTGSSFLTVWPTGAARPTASTLDFTAGQTVPNMVIAKVGDGGQISFYNNTGSVDVVVDVLGWFPTGSTYNSLVPNRLLDTRRATHVGANTRLTAGVPTDVQITGLAGGPPSAAAAAVLNVTVADPAASSFLTVWPSGVGRPLSSNINFTAMQAVPNMVIVKMGPGGKISLFSPTSTDVAIDVLGWFPATGSFVGVVPARLMDTRPSSTVGALTPGTSWQWQIDGNAINQTVLDASTNSKKMYDIDMFTSDAATIQQLHTKGIYVVCYVETGSWENYRPDASAYPSSVLGNALAGYPNERLVDIRQVSVLQPIIAARFDTAKAKGCDGIEPDLDDTYNGYNTGFPLTMQDQLTFNRAVADLAHARGMSIGLKNGASSGGVFEASMVQFTDWALNEECNQFGECGGYKVYIAANKAVFQVEYLGSGASVASICPADNAANFDGILKQSSASLAALPRIACRNG
ncbi:MAG: endo alpha-1,4 polygalactosaminidase [Ilumatobacteraceae bacterium]